MFAVVQQIFPFVFIIVWIGGTLILAIRWRAKQRRYLGRFPPVNGFPLDAPLERFMGMNPLGPAARAMRKAAWQRQGEPDLEELRQEMTRSYGAVVLWIFLVPFVTAAVLLVLTIVGLIP